MGRLARTLTLAAAALAAAGGCDPVVVLGDWPGIMRIVAGVPGEQGGAVDERAARTPLIAPRGLAAGGAGLVYIVDDTRLLSVSSSGELEVLLDHGACGEEPCMRRPEGVVLASGALILVDPSRHQVLRFDLVTRALTVLAGSGEQGASPDGTPAAEADLAAPTGLALDQHGTVYFSERGGARVRFLRSDGTLGTMAGTGEAGSDGDGGPAARARLNSPAGLAVGGGVLYIADSGNDVVRAVDLGTGRITRVAGNGVRAYGGDGGPATQAQLKNPRALAVSADALTLFIADAGNARVRAVNLLEGTISTFAGTGDPAFAGTGRAAGETPLADPAALATSPQDQLFIADTGNRLVWRTAIRL